MIKDLKLKMQNLWIDQSNKPLIIAGPCSAENREQLLNTAHEIANYGGVSIFRAGLWKPRTRPGSFEGVGEKGLEWLCEVRELCKFKVATEVANASHVEKCLKHNIDVLWLGARTTANPFAVQEIADALRGTATIVFVKNPINPDIELWIGAFERLNKAGIENMAAVHRGFSSFEKTPFRNAPMWQLPIELKTLCPTLPMLCDPSHIAGTTALVHFIAQKAYDLNFDGLMIETHTNPTTALSDQSQQLTPYELNVLLKKLIIREATVTDITFKNRLDELRAVIDKIDEEIIVKLAARMHISKKIGEFKKTNNVAVLQLPRWEEIFKKNMTLAKELGIDENFMKKILSLIHQESINIQTEILNSN